MTDLHYTKGQWEPIDILADCPDGSSVHEYLESIGWEEFLTIGTPGESFLAIKTYIHRSKNQYLLSVDDVAVVSPYTLVDTFPDLMDLISRWSPVIQTANLVGLLDDLTQLHLDKNGYAEMIAARARFGQEEVYETERRVLREQEEGARRRRQQREADRVAKADGSR